MPKVNRRDMIAGTAAAALQTGLALQPTQASEKRPNVLLIFMDDQSYRTIGSLNNPEVHTPNLDRLAARATVYTHAFNQGAWSGAVCIPSRAMLISGLTVWHSEHHIPEVPLWGEWFAKHGFKTYLTGKWHNGEETIKRCFTEVGPHAGGFLPSLPDLPEKANDAYNRPDSLRSWQPDDETRGGHWMKVDGKVVHSSVRWADAAIDFLNRQKGSPTPFFMHTAFHAPHDPRQAPREFLDMYPPENVALPPNYLPEHPFDQGDSRVRDEVLAPFPRTEEAVKLHRSEYYAILSHVDQQIGRILDTLKANGQENNTIVMFSGDHGLAVGQHGLMGKQNQYDHSVRIPLMIAGPGMKPGIRVDSLVYQSGLFPTACDLCGLPIPETVEHRSLVQRDTTGRLRPTNGYTHIHGGYMGLQRMIRDHEWKLIVYPKAGVEQLFHIKSDPFEIHNLAAIPEHANRIREIKANLRKLMTELGDTRATI